MRLESARRQARRRRAVTLVEVMVATAIGVLITGIVFGVLIATNQAAGRGIAREVLIQQAHLAMKEVTQILEQTVWPEDMASTPSAERPLLFGPRKLALYSAYRLDESNRYAYYTLGSYTEESGRRLAGYFYYSWDEGMSPVFRSLGPELEGELEFRYAEKARGAQPVWVEGFSTDTKATSVTLWVSDGARATTPVAETLPGLASRPMDVAFAAGDGDHVTSQTITVHAVNVSRPGLVYVRLTLRDRRKPDSAGRPLEVVLQTAVRLGGLEPVEGARP